MALVKSGTVIRWGVAFRDDLARATLEVYERYAIEVVERFGFCPWARSARDSGSVVLRVIFSEDQDDFAESLTCLEELHSAASVAVSEGPAPSAGTDIALFIYPLLDVERLAFENYTRRLRVNAEAREPALSAFAMAAFHPHAAADLSHPDRLVPFVRRSPDPTLQLVRKSALSAIKGLSHGTAFVDVSALSLSALQALQAPAPKAVRERIADENLATVREAGPEAVEAVLSDIFQQRERAHQGLLARHGRRGPRRWDKG
jgi:hypothetical protein